MRKIVSFIVLLICFTYLVGCSGAGIESGQQAETQPQNLVHESVTEYGRIQIDGKASAEIMDGVLKVSCEPEETLTDVTVDGRRIWLTDGEYSLGNSDKNTVIQKMCIRDSRYTGRFCDCISAMHVQLSCFQCGKFNARSAVS